MKPLRLQPLDYASAAGFLVYSSSVVITPVCLVILAGELAFGLAAGGFLEALRGFMVFIVLFASGFAAARWGKVKALGGGSLLLGAGLLLYAAAPSYEVVLCAMALMGVGSGVVEGLINPLIQRMHPQDSGRYLNILNGFWSVGVLATALVAGELLTREMSWRPIVAVLGGMSVITGAAFLAMSRQAPTEQSNSSGQMLRQMLSIARLGRFWLYMAAMFFGGAAEGAYTFWSASFIQIEHDGLPRAGGIGTASFSAGMILGRFGSGWFVGQKRLRRLILASAAAGFGASWLVPMIDGLLTLYAVLFVAGLTIACFWPSIQAYAADRLSVDATALLILLSCAGIPGFAFASWVMGEIGEAAGLGWAFAMIPIFFVLLALSIGTDRWQDHRRARPASPPGNQEDGV